MKKKYTAIVKKIIFSATAVILFFLAAEVLLMSAGFETNWARSYPPKPSYSLTRRYQLPKSVTQDLWETNYTLNSIGIRDEEIPLAKEPGEFRLICLGNSCTFGTATRLQQDETYAQIAERLLQDSFPATKIQVVNAGIPGYSSFQGYHFYKEVMQNYSADVVTISLGWNDHWYDYFSEREQYHLRRFDRILNRSVVFSLIYDLVNPEPGYFELANMTLWEYKPMVLKGDLPEFRNNIESLADLIRDNQSRVVLFTLPSESRFAHDGSGWFAEPNQYQGFTMHPQYNETIRAIARDKNISLFDLDLIMEGHKTDNPQDLFADFAHLNQRGHQIIAQELTTFLEREKLFITP